MNRGQGAMSPLPHLVPLIADRLHLWHACLEISRWHRRGDRRAQTARDLDRDRLVSAFLQDDRCKLCSGSDSELLKRVSDVGLDGASRHVERGADLSVGVSICNEFGDPALGR